jgi:hypothetical protein
MCEESLFTTSNHLISINSAQGDPKEEQIVHWSKEAMEMDQKISFHSMGGKEEAANQHVFS